MTNLLSPDERVFLEQMYTTIRRDASRVPLMLVFLLCLSLTFMLVFTVEYSLFYEVFSYLKAPMPGEYSQWSTGIFALTGVVMLVAYHLRARENPTALLVRFVTRLVDVLLPLYMVGAGLVIAAILYFDGADAFFDADIGTLYAQMQGWLDAEASPNPPNQVSSFLDTYIVPYFSVVFVMGAGALSVVNLFIGTRLLSEITTRVESIVERLWKAREAKTLMEGLRDDQAQYADLCAKHDALLNILNNQEKLALDTAARIVAIMSRPLRICKGWLTEKQLRDPYIKDNDGLGLFTNDIERKIRGMNPEVLQAKVEALEAYDVPKVLRAICPSPKSVGDPAQGQTTLPAGQLEAITTPQQGGLS